jgi:hypothetical protein
MTPREIHAGWQPLDADRESNYEGGTYYGTRQSKSWTTGNTFPGTVDSAGRPHPISETQQMRRNPGLHSGPGGTDTGTIERFRGGEKARVFDRGGDGEESDEQLWARKLDESMEYGRHGQHDDRDSDPLFAGGRGGRTMGTYEGQPTIRTGRSEPSDSAWERHYNREDSWERRRQDSRDGGESLYDSIAAEGVHGPIRLGSEMGSQGKPEIVGGHHRLAAATEAAPNRLVPVLHDVNIHHAREWAKRGGYPYS